MRWGVLSLRMAGLACRWGAPTSPSGASGGFSVPALLFAWGTCRLICSCRSPAWLTGLIVAANALPGLLFGWLFWRRGLEAAMGAHALAHLFAWAALAIV